MADARAEPVARRTGVAPLLEAAVSRDALVLGGLLVLAALLRFVDLPTRGSWDSDQGHDMLVLRALVREGGVPLLGPPTSIGHVHHGAWYYYLLAPAAWLSGASPTAVVAEIAAAGVAAVGVTWWIARTLAGPLASLVAGLAMAVSASAIGESTFIWNPNLIALTSSIAIAGAVRAWSTGRARWWVVAAVGAALTVECHVLGVVLLPPLAALLLADARRRTRAGDPAASRRILLAGLASLGVLGLAILPLVVNELTHDFAETRAALDYLRSGGEPVALALPARVVLVGLRVLTWPLSGLITDAFVPAALVAAALVATLAWRWRAATGLERTAIRWFAATLAWSTVALAVIAGGLATVTPGLPNDHYHAFLDPIVFATVGIGAARLAERGAAPAALAAVGVAAVLLFNVATQPPAVAPDGGWPAAQAAADRVVRATGDRDLAIVGLPTFKPADAMAFPLVDAGRTPTSASDAQALVVVCDRLFEATIGASCGGPAEEALHPEAAGFDRLVDRFDESTRTSVSVYLR